MYKVNPVHDAWDRALAAESICQDILSSARNQLYLNMRFMDCALSALFFQGDMGVHPVGTDGTVLYYQPEELMEQFRRSQEKVNRIYLHSLLHCIFLHCFPEKDEEGNPAVDVQYWNLACDITVENIIDWALSEMCASAGIYGEEAGVEADTGRGKGNDGSENLPKASDSSFAGK
ncbi:MAG: DUF2201 family putative metallopeptidase [Ruminococcus sp.]